MTTLAKGEIGDVRVSSLPYYITLHVASAHSPGLKSVWFAQWSFLRAD